ncbi:MAG: HD domain-containing protein [Alphaproteobacteria bacterium]|nr:HD domain-containing protein [Alphaproteobacteria bacterium]
MLSAERAKKLIEDLKEKEISLGRKPETWFTYQNHIMGVAKVAKIIASQIPGINAEELYVSAMLHDICRTEEDRACRFHGILGYEKLKNIDEKSARSSLLHMFPWNEIPEYEKCSKIFFDKKDDYDFIVDFIKSHELTDEDLLIQLTDYLANKNGIVTIEQRLIECCERYGAKVPQETVDKIYRLKAYFDAKIGCDIYTLLQNDFGTII